MRRTLCVVTFALSVAACAKHAPKATGFVGQWDCTTTSVVKFDGGKPDSKSTGHGTRTFSGDGTSIMSTYVDDKGQSSGCAGQWTVTGASATMKPNECTVKGAAGEIVAKTTSASANLTGDTLVESYTATFSGTQPGSGSTTGSMTGTYTCKRK